MTNEEKLKMIEQMIADFGMGNNTISVDSVIDIFIGNKTFDEVKVKIERGLPLSREEENVVLYKVYEDVRNMLKMLKKTKSTGAKLAFGAMSLVSKIMGEKVVGYHNAIVAIRVGEKEDIDNYKKILEGIKITFKHRALENFKTLLSQYDKAFCYSENLNQVENGILKRGASKVKDYSMPIEEESQRNLQKIRQDIVRLSKQYKEVNSR